MVAPNQNQTDEEKLIKINIDTKTLIILTAILSQGPEQARVFSQMFLSILERHKTDSSNEFTIILK